MKKRFRLVCVGSRGGMFYCDDTVTKQRSSLRTYDSAEAQRMIDAKNDALRQPALNLQIARAYLAGADGSFSSRTWQNAMAALVETKQGSTKLRWFRAVKDKAFDCLRHRVITESQAEILFQALKDGTVSTNVHLRKLHNFVLDMGWLPYPIVPKRRWPAITFKDKRAITREEHQRILAVETNPERNIYYQLCWHLGAAQSDIARLSAEDIDWQARVVSFFRQKTGTVSLVRMDDELEQLLHRLPQSGPLFPNFGKLRESHRATEFKRCCRRAGIQGVTLHSYRYAWAERAKCAGYPERFAQEALGHNSKAVHRAYARNAKVELPSLGDYERQRAAFVEAGKAVAPIAQFANG